MPYSPSNPPEKLRKLSPKRQRQWVHVFNQALEQGDDEGKAHAKAWGVVKKSSEGEMIGPTESEGSLADAIRNKDIMDASLDHHAAVEMKAIANEMVPLNRTIAKAIVREALGLDEG